LGHWLVASKTGVIAGGIASIVLILSRTNRRWVVSALLGIVTALVDYMVHPGHFGPVAMEAAVTGLGAALLSYLVAVVVRRFRTRATAMIS